MSDSNPFPSTRCEHRPVGCREILVVEDDVDMSNLIEQLLTDKGYQVVSVNSPVDALNVVECLGEHDSPLYALDLVITDWWMPEMTGGEFLTWLREHDASTPIVVISAYLTDETARQTLQLDASAVLSKPFALEELVEIVDGELQS